MSTEISLSSSTAIINEQRFVERLAQCQADIVRAIEGIAAWTLFGYRRMHEAGKILEDVKRLLPGDYTVFVESNAERIGFCPRTAYTYRKFFAVIETMGGFDAAAEYFPDRHEFLVWLGVLRQKAASDHTPKPTELAFSGSVKINRENVEEWPIEVARDFWKRFVEPVEALKPRVAARLAAA